MKHHSPAEPKVIILDRFLPFLKSTHGSYVLYIAVHCRVMSPDRKPSEQVQGGSTANWSRNFLGRMAAAPMRLVVILHGT